ncbi:MAG: molybdopterin molybdotransferase MoeA, partial [Gammaproteobacteria bacterium]|nr:molybdopterin molybdotransferase MoeA [Gammaproteobacteria bacterium]
MLSVREAVQQMLDSVQPITEIETVFIADAVDRVLAQAIHSTLDIPSYDNSAMDGYALRAEDLSQTGTTLTLVGQALAGHSFQGEIKPGECIRIMTGAQVPASATAVIPQEDTERDAENSKQIKFNVTATVGQNIRRQGEELKIGAAVFAVGHRFTPVDIGLLASLGIAEVAVKQQLTIALFSTGDELVQPGQPKRADQIYDSNRFVLHAMIERMGFNVLNLGLIPDNKQEIADAFMTAAAKADAIVCSGGVSVGDADYTKQV